MTEAQDVNRSILVAGGGISGLTAAIEAAEAGFRVYLVEKAPYLGGRVATMNKYFPKLCPPNCGLEINFRRIKSNPLIRFFTLSEITEIKGEAGRFDVTVRMNPRYITDACTGCGACEAAAETEVPNPYGLGKVKAAFLPHTFAFPMRYVLAPQVLGTDEAGRIAAACRYGAVDLDMQPTTFDLQVGAVVCATGWTPYDVSKIRYYGGGAFRNVVNNAAFEKIAATGRIFRPSDGAPVKKIAFVQCAGSRDENHLPYCSGVCCLASLKQATYCFDADDEITASMFYIDIRALGKYEAFFTKVSADPRLTLIKGKPGEIVEDPATGLVTVQVEDQETGRILKESFDLVVLAGGMVPTTVADRLPVEAVYDECGFMLPDQPIPGIIPAGTVKQPMDVASTVRDATAAALKAIQATCRR